MSEITKGNPYGCPTLGREVDIKDYSTGITPQSTEKTPQEKSEEYMPPPPESERTEETKEKPVKEKPPEDFGTDYTGDGVDDYTEVNDTKTIQTEDGEETQPPAPDPDVQIPEVDADLFSKIVVNGFVQYVPGLFAGLANKISGVRRVDVEYHTATKRIPAEFAELYKKSKAQLKADLQITEEEAALLQESLNKYLQYQNIQTANPANAFFLQAGMILLRQSITAIQHGAEQRQSWNTLFRKYGIENPRKHEYTITDKED